MKKYSLVDRMIIMNIVNNNRFIKDRIKKLAEKGYIVTEKPVFSGGVGTIHKLKNEWRFQIGYSHGNDRCNYAQCVIFEPNKSYIWQEETIKDNII